MLQNMRKSTKGPTAKIIVGLIVIAFAFFGIESILLSGGGNSIAEVNGEPIYPGELDHAIQATQRRLMSMYGENIDPAMLDQKRLQPRALEELISRRLLVQAAEEMDLVVSEREIGAMVAGMSEFQVDGNFSSEMYKRVIANAGYSPASFKMLLRDDLLLNQVSGGIGATEFVTPAEMALSARILGEQRDFRYFAIPTDDGNPELAATEEEIVAYYEEHPENFRSPETVDLVYLELELDDFRQPVEERVIQEAYELAVQDAQFLTQHRVSHILFEEKDGESLGQRVQDARDRVSSGDAFADVAREYSDDIGSAEKGGDLGYTSGDTFPDAMEEVIARLEPGVVSEPVETPAGTHLVLVTERKAGEAPGLEEMRAELEERLSAEEARVELLRVVELLRDLSFNADNLVDPAEEFDLTVESVSGISRNEADGLFGNPSLLEAAFSEEVLISGHNSEVIELSGERFVVLRVSKHNQPELMPLDEVSEQIAAAVARENARDEVERKAGESLRQLQNGEDIAEVAEGLGYDLQVELGADRTSTTAPLDVLRRVFELPVPSGELASTDYFTTPNGDAVIVELQRVQPGDFAAMPETEQLQLRRLVTGEQGARVYGEYQQGLRERAEVTVL